MITCKRCVTAKPEDQMLQRRGKPSKVCLECFRKAHFKGVDKADSDAKAKLRAKRGAKKKNGKAPAESAKFAMSATYGFEAHVDENGMLNIFQANGEGSDPDQVILSKAEAANLFRSFAEFAGTD